MKHTALAGAVLGLVVFATGCMSASHGPPKAEPTLPLLTALATQEPPPPLPKIERYVALGDSFTAAPLVPEMELTSAECIRSTANYPKLVAKELKAKVLDRSCTGADTHDLDTVKAALLGDVAPQLAALDRDTDLVTLSMGGNDAELFGTLMTECPTYRDTDPTGSPCRAAMQRDGEDKLLTALRQTGDSLVAAIREIRRLAPKARVLVVGYPKLAPDEGTCPDLLPLADDDYAYVDEVNRALNDTLRAAADSASVEYVDVYAASEGHDVCSDEPWVNGAVTTADKALQYHPFASEQRAVAELVLDTLRSGERGQL